MSNGQRMTTNTSNVLSVIMGGGQGTRLFPLTKDRAKPAVPLAGKYRLVDIPISNCMNSGLRRVYLLTQFNSASLHRHISQSYKFDHFSGGFVEILAAQQTFDDTSWYQGTADAVRKNMIHFLNHDFEYLLILSGDQLYRMDFRHIVAQHVETAADLTIATIPVVRQAAQSLGMSRLQALRLIVLPQAIRVIIPPTGNETISMLKTTSLAIQVALPELLGSVQNIYSQNFKVIPLLLVATIWYLIVTSILTVGQFYVERYFARGATRTLPPTPLQRLRALFGRNLTTFHPDVPLTLPRGERR